MLEMKRENGAKATELALRQRVEFAMKSCEEDTKNGLQRIG
jgi:hypothetical protein